MLVCRHEDSGEIGTRACWCRLFFFFFSSRRRHTRFDCDWSSDVCSSDLLAFGGLLVAGALTLIGAAVRESVLEPGAVPDRRRTLHARIAMTIGAVVLALTLLGGGAWWNAVDAAYRTGLYQPLHATATVRPAGGAGGRVLRLAIDDTSWTGPKRQWTPLVPDHGHLMHLFLVREIGRAHV